MKTMKYFLSMAALALVGAMTVSCSSDDNIIDQPQQQEVTKNNVVTLTTTVGFDEAAGTTRALSSTGVKTFAAGETMAVIYNNGTSFVKAVSHALEAGDITNEGKNATFTFDLETPDKNGPVRYIYPAAMAGDTGVDLTKLNTQEGTFDALQSKYDFCTNSGAWEGDNLPSLTLENQIAILAITLKNEAGTSDITGSTTKLTVSDGTNTYNVNRSAADGPIYVAILPTTEATISIQAINGSQGYYKTLTTTKSYAANNGYSVSWRMTQGANLSLLTAAYTAQNGDKLTGTLGNNVKISIADGATVKLKDVTINGVNNYSNQWAGITCEGNATITLEGTNTLKGFYDDYPGIYVPQNKTLTIEGEGSLKATSNGDAPGIGAGADKSCGNIVINGGNITATANGNHASGIGGGENAHAGNITINGGNVTATGDTRAAGIGGGSGDVGNITITGGTVKATGGYRSAGIGGGYEHVCGDITISGGTVTAKGGEDAAGIGGGRDGSCGNITITSGVTQVTATKGSSSAQSIGAGKNGTAITVNIEAGANVTQN